jgi:hypothetical protein
VPELRFFDQKASIREHRLQQSAIAVSLEHYGAAEIKKGERTAEIKIFS